MYVVFLIAREQAHKNRSKCHSGPTIQGSRFITVFIRFFRKLPDYCHEYIPIISFRKCNFPTVYNHLRSFSELLKLKYLVHNLQVVFGDTNELVNIHKAILNQFCVVIYGHSKVRYFTTVVRWQLGTRIYKWQVISVTEEQPALTVLHACHYSVLWLSKQLIIIFIIIITINKYSVAHM